jgi:SAM-dependent methyltransferase
MLLDVDRNSKYQQAIAKAVSKLNKDDLVLDIGTGTGLLSCFAANAGACNVVGCEANAPIARVAYAIVKKNKLTKQVKVVLKHSTDLKIADNEKSDNNNDNDNSMLQKKASLVISEILDCGLLGEQVLPVVKHARKHLMKEGAIALPARARVKGVLVDLTSCGPIALSRPTTIIGPSGNTMNGSVFNKFLRWNTWEQIRLLDMPHVVRLSEPLDMMEIDLRGFEDESSVKQTILNVQCIADGTVSAVVMWFDVDLDEEGEFMITTSPDNLQSCWSQALQLIDGNHDSVSSKQVSAGNSVQVQCSYNDDRIKVDLL